VDFSLSSLLRDSRYAARAVSVELGSAASEEERIAFLADNASVPWTIERISLALDAGQSQTPLDSERLAAALRGIRRRVLLGVMVRDVSGVATLDEVTASMTALAEVAVTSSLSACARELAARHGVPTAPDGTPQDLLVVAMGKGGSCELNVSSDLDLVFVYDEEGEAGTLSSHEFFERLGKRLIATLSDATAEGFVFRVDMRLRPHGAGPLAVSNAMLEEYLIAHGREWERFAWLKGRVISTPVFATPAQFAAQARALDDIVRPFVFRKYLDFGAIAALRELHALIRAETGRKSARRAGGREDHEANVKLGRGGIREIEFVAQAFQIVRGGRDARLRSRATLVTLGELGALGVLAAETCEKLAEAYKFLRRLEHALQYVDDAQTHAVPEGGAGRERIARLLRMDSAATLMQAFAATRDFVAGVFDSVFVDRFHARTSESRVLDGDVQPRLAELGYQHPAEGAGRIRALLAARRVVTSASSRQAIEAVLAPALETIAAIHGEAAHGARADELLARFIRLLDVLAGRTTYLTLLAQYPHTVARVLRLLAASRWAADYLLRHPILLDELLDERLTELTNASPVDWSAWRTTLLAQLHAHADDQERRMNLLRDAHHAQVFRLLVADLDGRLTVERLADHLSALADAALEVALDCAWESLARRHRERPRFALIGYGKLGGKELGYASDLDLIFVFDDEFADAQEIYGLLARRFIAWVTTLTSSGVLFDLDLRLRPDGEKGLLVSSLEGFARYERNEDGHGAWIWEHQALTRARFCAGDAAIGALVERVRSEVLATPRDAKELAQAVLAMRGRMLDGHPNRTDLFDLKHDRGGMVDIEFIVQFLVLAFAHTHSRLLGNLGNIALLRIAGEADLIDAGLAGRVADAYRDFRRAQHQLRLNAVEGAATGAGVPQEEMAKQIGNVLALWRAVFGTDAPARKS